MLVIYLWIVFVQSNWACEKISGRQIKIIHLFINSQITEAFPEIDTLEAEIGSRYLYLPMNKVYAHGLHKRTWITESDYVRRQNKRISANHCRDSASADPIPFK
jgi:hypothetical protein